MPPRRTNRERVDMTYRSSRLVRTRGVVLLLVLGIVALLSFLVAAFAILSSIERKASHNHRDGERARCVARSGLERAKFELRRAATTNGYPLNWTIYDFNNPGGW